MKKLKGLMMNSNEPSKFNRRRFLGVSGTILAGLNLTGPSIVHAAGVKSARNIKAKHVLRLAHMTDLHIQPELGADKGLAACLHHIQSLKDKPSLIVTGGDCVFDSLGKDDQRTTTQWNLYHSVMKAECGLPVKSCIGNHDIWGWNKKASQTTGDELLWGKKRAVHELKLSNHFYSFDQAGWHFVMLDGTQLNPNGGYIAKLDDEQFEWLAGDLAKTPASTPVLIVSHESIVSAAAFFRSGVASEEGWKISAGRMFLDAVRLKDLFKKHPNVKLCLSGHLHLVDRIEYCGVTYICDGSVSGAWWKGDNQECDEGYGVVDLYDDGSFEHQYVAYNWKPFAENQV